MKESSCTILYSAPELLLGDLRIGPEMDMWSLGCVAAELFLREPLFKPSWSSHPTLRVLEEHSAYLGMPQDTITYAWMKAVPFADDFFGLDARVIARPCLHAVRLHCCQPQLADFVRQPCSGSPYND